MPDTPPVPPAAPAAPSAGKPEAVSGVYELCVDVWNRLVSLPGEGKRFVRHVRGDLVELEEATASRLLRSGAVKPTSADQEATTAGATPNRFDNAKEQALAATGQQPVTGTSGPAPSAATS